MVTHHLEARGISDPLVLAAETFVHFNSRSSLDCGTSLHGAADCPNAW